MQMVVLSARDYGRTKNIMNITLTHKNNRGELTHYAVRYLNGERLVDMEVRGAKNSAEAAKYVLKTLHDADDWRVHKLKRIRKPSDLWGENTPNVMYICLKVYYLDHPTEAYDLLIATLVKRNS